MTGVLFPARERYYFLYSLKTGPGTHLASCPAMDIYVRVRRQLFEADHSPLSSAEVKSVGAVPALPHTSLINIFFVHKFSRLSLHK
jgi:hypothetical protein